MSTTTTGEPTPVTLAADLPPVTTTKSGRKPRRKQARKSLTFSATQYYVLEHMFVYKPYPQFRQPNEYETMAKAIGLETAQVRIWFQNRRSRRRAKLLKGESPPPPKHLDNTEGLTEDDLDVMTRDVIAHLETVIRPTGASGELAIGLDDGAQQHFAVPTFAAQAVHSHPDHAVPQHTTLVKRPRDDDAVPSPVVKVARTVAPAPAPAPAALPVPAAVAAPAVPAVAGDQVAPELAPEIGFGSDMTSFDEAVHPLSPMPTISPVPSFSDRMDMSFMPILSPSASDDDDAKYFSSYASSYASSHSSPVIDPISTSVLDLYQTSAVGALSPEEFADMAFA